MPKTNARIPILVILLTIITFANPLVAEGGGFSDGFEIGDVSSWSAFQGGPPITPPAPLRFTSFEIRDPHFFGDFPVPVGCFDFTDDPIPIVGTPSVNDSTATAMVSDDDLDGCLDFSLMLLFRPFNASGVGEIVDTRSGNCTFPDTSTSCHVKTQGTAERGAYDGLTADPCLMVLPGTTSGYTPGITEPSAPCFVTAADDLSLSIFADQPLPLRDTQISATTVSTAPDNLTEGLIYGFLREEDADALLIPADIPILGGLPLSVLFPGGTGNCAPGDDTDMHEGFNGWWFYVNFTAENVPWTGL